MPALSEYEKKRLENIKANEALLRNLEIPTIKKETIVKKELRKHVPKPIEKPKAVPTRASARLRGKEPDMKIKDDIDTLDYHPAKRPRHPELLDEEGKKQLLEVIKLMPNTEPKVKKEDEPEKIESDASLKKSLEKLQIRHEWSTIKVTNNRITHCLFHPSKEKLLACAVDTEGGIGFWDVNGVQDDGDPVTYNYRLHSRTVTDIHFNPVSSDKLLTSSYDGLVRIFDMNTGDFESLYMGSEDYSVTGFDLTEDGHCMWFATSYGEAGWTDIRTNDDPVVRQPKGAKIGCIHINPVDQNLIVMACNDRTATIWDRRMYGNSKKDKPLQEIEHGYSVTSSYWSPKGDKLATTSYDDFVRLFSLQSDKKSVELDKAIPHNCHTGRWVTNLRARWNTNKVNGLDTQHLVLGNMNHTVDVISGETGNRIVELYDGDHITAIPAVAQFHPSTPHPVILTGNGSGRMVCWS